MINKLDKHSQMYSHFWRTTVQFNYISYKYKDLECNLRFEFQISLGTLSVHRVHQSFETYYLLSAIISLVRLSYMYNTTVRKVLIFTINAIIFIY